jgi:hypothetical protein
MRYRPIEVARPKAPLTFEMMKLDVDKWVECVNWVQLSDH